MHNTKLLLRNLTSIANMGALVTGRNIMSMLSENLHLLSDEEILTGLVMGIFYA